MSRKRKKNQRGDPLPISSHYRIDRWLLIREIRKIGDRLHLAKTEEERQRIIQELRTLKKKLRKVHKAERAAERAEALAKSDQTIQLVYAQALNPARKSLCRATKQGFKNAVRHPRRRRRKPDPDGKSVRALQGGFCDGHGKQGKWKKGD